METDQESVLTGRRYPRIRQELPFTFRILQPEKEKEWILTKTKILGGGGVSVISPVCLPVGTVLHAKLIYYAKTIEFTAEIVWAEAFCIGAIPQTRYGLSFTQISQESLLAIHDIINDGKNRQIQAL